MYELQHQVKGIAVRILFTSSDNLWSNLCSREIIGWVELHQVPKDSGYV